jgi:hypothetical protein
LNAQDDLKQTVNSIIQGEKDIKSEAISELKTDSTIKSGEAKEQIKTPKKIIKKSKKKKKKIHKIIRKRIIKKVYVIKKDTIKKPEETLPTKELEKNEIDESLEKYKKGELNNFEEIEGGVLMTDIIHYKIPLGVLGNLANRLFIKRQLRSIFEFRIKKVNELFGQMK